MRRSKDGTMCTNKRSSCAEGSKIYIISNRKIQRIHICSHFIDRRKKWFGEKAIACAGVNRSIRLFTEKQWGSFIDKLRGRPFNELKRIRGSISFTQEYFLHILLKVSESIYQSSYWIKVTQMNRAA